MIHQTQGRTTSAPIAPRGPAGRATTARRLPRATPWPWAALLVLLTPRRFAQRCAERFWVAVAWRLPRPLVMWASVRLIAHATQGEHSSTVVPDLTAMDALRRWERAEC